jgi:pseudouridine-5'-phosphate glycosidase
MATECAGVTATWDSVALGEITEIKVLVGGSLPVYRGGTHSPAGWSLDMGAIDISCLSTAQITLAQYGKKATLDIGGGGLTFTAKCICQTLRLEGTVNDVARYAASFKLAPN